MPCKLDSLHKSAFMSLYFLERTGAEFNTEYLVPWKLFLLAVCILAFRRLPFLLAIHRGIPALPDLKQSLFAGW